MKYYSLGFIYQEDSVYLINKKYGWNGFGGLILNKQTPLESIITSTNENCDFNEKWYEFANLKYPDLEIICYFSSLNNNKLLNHSENDQIQKINLEDIFKLVKDSKMLINTSVLIFAGFDAKNHLDFDKTFPYTEIAYC